MTDPTQGLPVDRTEPVPAPPHGDPASGPAQGAPAQGAPGPAAQHGAPVAAASPVPRAQEGTGARSRARVRSRGPLGPVVAAAAVAGLLAGLGGGVLAGQLIGDPDGGSPVVAEAQPQAPAEAPEPAPVPADGTIPALSRAVLPSVALISVGADGNDGLGSGFVIREDGYLLTNAHVIADAREVTGITVEFPGEEALEAEVVGSDTAYDIAVLKVDRTGLPELPFAASEEVQVGQTVVAVGAPLGLDSTVTSGIVSALDRPVVAGEDPTSVSYINAIQTDAAINPGNSGGPLLDLSGQVVGVNSALAQLPTSTLGGPAGSIGLGFAIPADQAERTATQLIETGSSEHPVMGVHIDLDYTGDGARVLPQARGGVDPVVPGGPADAVGVRAGDVIVSVDDTRIRDSRHLLVVLRSYQVGDTVEMVLRDRDGAERTVSITLAGSGD